MRRVRGLLRISLSYNILPLFSTDASIYVSFSPSYKPPFDKGRLFFRRPHAVVFPGETTAGEILISTFPPNLPLPALRAASVAAPRHPASGCARLATRVTKGDFFPTSPCRRISGRNNSRRNPHFDIPSKPPFAGAARGFRCGASALRKRVRSAGDTGDKGRLFPAFPCSRISERNNSRRNPFPDIHEPSSCQKTGFAAAATSVASTHNDTGKSEKNDPNACFFARNALSLSPRLVKAAAHPIMQQK